eukprot:scaffold1007_cov176-Amphora_coffeaeformis.AAC.22
MTYRLTRIGEEKDAPVAIVRIGSVEFGNSCSNVINWIDNTRIRGYMRDAYNGYGLWIDCFSMDRVRAVQHGRQAVQVYFSRTRGDSILFFVFAFDRRNGQYGPSRMRTCPSTGGNEIGGIFGLRNQNNIFTVVTLLVLVGGHGVK